MNLVSAVICLLGRMHTNVLVLAETGSCAVSNKFENIRQSSGLFASHGTTGM